VKYSKRLAARDIALVNELKRLTDDMGIDIWGVITNPFVDGVPFAFAA
jgi:UDP-N-acetyl-D-mannosaminuronate dehydrogenase